MLVGLHLRVFKMQVIVVGVDLMTLFEHVIDVIKQINFLKRNQLVWVSFYGTAWLHLLSSLVWILSFISHKLAGDIMASAYIKSIIH